MQLRKCFKKMTAVLLTVCTMGSTVLAYDGVYTDQEGNISYTPYEQGVHSNGGYTVDKVSHPTLGAGEVDSILTGEDQDRGQSYSWSMAEAGDYVYIGTCYNSTYYIYHNNVKTTLQGLQSSGVIDADLDAGQLADEIVRVAFGADSFDSTLMEDWAPVIMAVNKFTGESQIIFRERDVWSQYPDIFPGYAPQLSVKNYLSGYRMAFEFQGKLYFAGMGSPTATLVEIDPATNEAQIVYYNINRTRGVANGVHGLLVYDGEILMCLATDNYDGNGTPGGIIVASSDPSASLENWRVIANQDDFEGLPAVMQIDGLNGGGVWDIIEYNGYLYVTVVTDKTDPVTMETNKQGFAMYRGEKQADNSFTWTQVIGDHSEYGFGLGINYSMACNMWVYDNHLYLGTYNDPMLDLAAVPASGNFEHLYNDLDHSIYLYRMDAEENFEQVAGKNDNPYFPDGPVGNLGAGLGNNSNQYVWRYGVHNGELYIGTYDTSTLTYMFTQLTDGQVANMNYEDISGRADLLEDVLMQVLNQEEHPYLAYILSKLLFNDTVLDLFQKLSGFATDMSADWNPVPSYREYLENYDAAKEKLLAEMERLFGQENFLEEYQSVMQMSQEELQVYSAQAGLQTREELVSSIQEEIRERAEALLAAYDEVFYDKLIRNFVYYFGVNYYAQQCEPGFDLLISNDGLNFDAITRDGFGDKYNHGLRTICSTAQGVYMGTANPFYGTQLWRLHSDADEPITHDCPSLAFSDLDTSCWYHEYTDYVIENGLMNGFEDGTFRPHDAMTRGMFVEVLYRIAGEPEVEELSDFTDVPSDCYYANAVAWAEDNGITAGVSETTFAPDEFITREQAATLLYRYVKNYLGQEMTAGTDLTGYIDAALVSDYAKEAVSWANGAGLMEGHGDASIRPTAMLARVEAAKLLTVLSRDF